MPAMLQQARANWKLQQQRAQPVQQGGPPPNNLMSQLMSKLDNMGLSIEPQQAQPRFKGYNYYKQLQASPIGQPPVFAQALQTGI